LNLGPRRRTNTGAASIQGAAKIQQAVVEIGQLQGRVD